MLNRQQGVVVPSGQRRDLERTEPNKILDIIPANVYAVRYGDGSGKIIKEFWYEVAGVLYQPPGAEQFANQLKEVKETLVKQARSLIAKTASSVQGVPSADAVDIIAQQTAREVSADNEVDV